MMPKYINANDLLNARFQTADHPYRLGWNDALEAARENAPSANVEPVIISFWKDANGNRSEGAHFAWWCDNCGKPQTNSVSKTLTEFTEENRFCHWCGAKMETRS